MENLFDTTPHTHPVLGVVFSLASILSAIFAWMSLQEFQVMAAIVASIMAAISALFGARYFWYATKEKKQAIQKTKS